jgi:hypothetical protein
VGGVLSKVAETEPRLLLKEEHMNNYTIREARRPYKRPTFTEKAFAGVAVAGMAWWIFAAAWWIVERVRQLGLGKWSLIIMLSVGVYLSLTSKDD